MNTPAELWEAWHASAEIRKLAEAWATQPSADWTEDSDRLYALFSSAPDQALATILAVMQITDDQQVLANLAAGPLEDFLGIQGEAYIESIHVLALEHHRLREVLDGVWQGGMPKGVWHRIETLRQRAFS